MKKAEQLSINEKVLEMMYRTECEVKIATESEWRKPYINVSRETK